MGSDTPPEVLYQAILLLQQAPIAVDLVLFATPNIFHTLSPFSQTVCSSEIVTMDDDPLIAYRHKKDSSMAVGFQWLKNKKIDAFVSAGNTGALIAHAKLSLKMLPGIHRPALLTLLPTKRNEIAVLDVGANLTLKTEHILQFAAMGIAYQKTRGIKEPTVGLLNVGVEAKKGTPQLREAYQKLLGLNQNGLVFSGNIEGRDVFQGKVDVLVTDGFTGNVFLKTAEGIAAFILDELETHVDRPSHFDLQQYSRIRERFNYSKYPGALVCGVEEIVIKCHGNTGAQSLKSSIEEALKLLQHQFLKNIKAQLLINS
jgi:glycerol-3-phosphate acyltransferase PlsX